MPASHTLYLLAHSVKQFVLDLHESSRNTRYARSIVPRCSRINAPQAFFTQLQQGSSARSTSRRRAGRRIVVSSKGPHSRLTGCFEAAPRLGRRHRRPWVRPRRRPRRAAGRGCGCHVPTSRAGRPAHHTPRRAWPRAPRAPREARRRDVGRGRRTRRAAPTAPGTGTTPVDPMRLPPPLLPGRFRPNPEPAKAHSIVRLLRLLALAGRPRSPRCSPVDSVYVRGEQE